MQCCARGDIYCDRCDLLVGLPGLRVIQILESGAGLVVTVESPPTPMGCPLCGVIAASHGRRTVALVDAPCFGRPVRVVWRKRTWRCREPACPGRSFTEQDDRVCRPRALLTVRACWWAIGQLRAEHASIGGLARQLGTTWRTVWRSIEPLLQVMADDPSRFDGVTSLGVDEHLWHHVDERRRGPRALTGMVDLTRDQHGHGPSAAARPGPGPLRARPTPTGSKPAARRSGAGCRSRPWTRSTATRTPSTTNSPTPSPSSTPFMWSSSAGRPSRRSAAASSKPSHGHRGRKGDPLYGIRNLLRCGAENARPTGNRPGLPPRSTPTNATSRCSSPGSAPNSCAQVYHQTSPPTGRRSATKIIDSFPSCPIPEIARLGRTLKRWRAAFLAYFDTGGASNGGTEAINGLIELHRRIARGFRNRDNYRLRMLLIGGGLNPPEV